MTNEEKKDLAYDLETYHGVKKPEIISDRIWEEKLKNPEVPVFICKISKYTNKEMSFRCPFCLGEHTHGTADGYRASHCPIFRNEYMVAVPENKKRKG